MPQDARNPIGADSEASTPPRRAVRIARAAAAIERTFIQHGRLTRREITRTLDHKFAGEDAGWEPGDAHEACEGAMTAFLRRHARVMNTSAPDVETLDQMIHAVAVREPRIRGRSPRHDRSQHYATSLDVGWAMAVAADIEACDTVLDPSGGTGTLAAMCGAAEPAATIHANEADPIRAELLRLIAPGIEVRQGDATQLAAEHPAWREAHDVVLLNPPFSRRLGSDGKHRNEDLRHLAAAREMTAPGGRIVALLGGGTRLRQKAWDECQKRQ